MLYAIEEHDTDVDGVHLRWTEMGRVSKKAPVVMLHGLNNSRFSWSCVAPFLARDRRVFLLDLPGHGDSDRPDLGYELEWYARTVARWLEKAGIERADVVGHSFGGGVAQMLLLECPARVRRLVLIASGGLGKDVGVLLRLASLPYLVERFGQPFMALGAKLVLREIRGKLEAKEIARLVRFNSLPGSARAFARTVRNVIDWRGQRHSFLHRAHEVKKLPPVLLLWGDKDNLIPIQQGREFARRLQGSLLRVFEGCGHFLHNEAPAEVARAVVDFFDDPKVRPTELDVTLAMA
jgi:pimeloyl-ACP methyl ester carboxylesterase